MSEIAADVREGLLAIAVGAGLQVMAAMMAADVTALCGPRGRHDPDRAATRHGSEDGSVTLGGRRVGVRRPRVRAVDGSGELPVASYEEMLEMSASGAKVLMLRAVELARNQDVPIHARSTFSTEPGTWIQGAEGLEQAIVSAVTHSEDEVLFDLRGVPDRPGSAAAIFEAVAAEHVNVDTILQNVGHESAELSFSVPQDDVHATRRALERAQETIGPIEIDEVSDLGKVALIGAGMRSHPGVAARMFRTLADEEINLRLITTSPIKVSCLIPRKDIERAVRALHEAFSLGDE
jgi:aspartate kinase